jgi:hypothetical protein
LKIEIERLKWKNEFSHSGIKVIPGNLRQKLFIRPTSSINGEEVEY